MTTKILCVDDDPLILAAFSRLLHRSYDLHTAQDAAEAIGTISGSSQNPSILTV